jgi:hypothetical protein
VGEVVYGSDESNFTGEDFALSIPVAGAASLVGLGVGATWLEGGFTEDSIVASVDTVDSFLGEYVSTLVADPILLDIPLEVADDIVADVFYESAVAMFEDIGIDLLALLLL